MTSFLVPYRPLINAMSAFVATMRHADDRRMR